MADNKNQEAQEPDNLAGEINIGFWGAVGYRIFDTFMKVLEKGHWYVGLLIVPYYTYHSIGVLAGKDTTADININIKDSLSTIFESVNKYLVGTIIVETLIIIILIIVILAIRRTLNSYKRKTGRLEHGIMDPLDNNRGSSNLTDTGTTNPGDKP